MNPILVTGGSGFIGGHLVRSLARLGIDTVSVFHTASCVEDRYHVRVDLRDTPALQRLFREFNFSAVVHLAASGVSAETESFQDLVEVNTLATAALGRVALACNIERFVYVGSALEYRPQAQPMDESTPLGAPNLYGASKAAGWMLLDTLHRLEGLPLITFRPFSAYGPGERPEKLVPYVFSRALREEPIRLALGSQVRDCVFVEDVVEALRLSSRSFSPALLLSQCGARFIPLAACKTPLDCGNRSAFSSWPMPRSACILAARPVRLRNCAAP